ncbi:MAG: hypothetical protein LBD06_00790 [Candidatus Accumulibacter sp.]|jgi:type III secretion protein Y|nr:hypothetical protein [Accumulibacter sp.]
MEELEPEQVTSLKVLGFLYLRLGFFARAARLFQALLALLPEDAGVAKSLAAALLEDGKAGEALALLDAPPLRADPSMPADPVFLLLKARSLWRLQRGEEAFAAMEAYLAATGGGR